MAPSGMIRSASAAGTFGYLSASVLWGWNIPLTAVLLLALDPFWIAPLRYVAAGVVLGVWLVATEGWAHLAMPRPAGRILVLSLLVASFLLLFNFGMLFSHPVSVAAIIAGSPVYVAVIARVMVGARLERGFVPACAMTIIGAGIAVAGRAAAGGMAFKGGEFLTLAAIGCWTVYSILAQRWFPAGASQLRRTYLTTIGAIPWLVGFWVVARAMGIAGPAGWGADWATWRDLLLAGGLCTGVATVGWNTGVARLGINQGAMWQNTVPVFAVLISALFFGITPLPAQLAGGGLVLAGVSYMQWRRGQAASA